MRKSYIYLNGKREREKNDYFQEEKRETVIKKNDDQIRRLFTLFFFVFSISIYKWFRKMRSH